LLALSMEKTAIASARMAIGKINFRSRFTTLCS
jgi:hypothetical protein